MIMFAVRFVHVTAQFDEAIIPFYSNGYGDECCGKVKCADNP